MKDIFILIDNLGSGGAQKQIVLLANALVDRGYRINLFTYGISNHFCSALDIRVCSNFYSSKFECIFYLLKFGYSIRPGTIISFLRTPNFIAVFVSKFMWWNPKVIVSERGGKEAELRASLVARLSLFFLQFSTVITANSRSMLSFLKNKYKFKKVIYVPNFVVFDSTLIPSRIKEPVDNISFLVVGRLHNDKNPLLVFDVLSKISLMTSKNINIFWVGRIENNQLFRQVNDYLNQVNIKWHWIGETSSLFEYYCSCDCLLSFSSSEGFPNVILEAFSFGLPVIASNVSDNSDLVSNDCGFVCDVSSEISVLESVKNFISLKSEDLRLMRLSCIETAKKYNAQATIELYEAII